MKRTLTFGVVAFAFLAIGVIAFSYSPETGIPPAEPQDDVKMPDVVVLGKDSKLGQVPFSHVKHNGGTYSIDGTGPIACVECHHAAQPVSELVKHPPLKTAWPTDRTTTLTAELFAKDPRGAAVAACRDCHARAGEKPKLLAAIPEIKHESSTAMISLTNQQALHRNCAGCHTEVAKTKKPMKGPTTMQCMMCHKKA